MLQLPALVRVTVLPVTVQLAVAEKVTGKPDDAVAVTSNGGSPNVRLDKGPKVIV
jgi:hypothetical protein